MQTQSQTATAQTEPTERPANAREFQMSCRIAHEMNNGMSQRDGAARVVWTDVFRALERCGVFPAEGL